MQRAFLGILVFTAIAAATPGVARGDGYFLGVGVGGDARLGAELAEQFTAEGEASGRIVLGKRMGPWAVEGAFFGTDVRSRYSDVPYSTLSLGLDLRYFLPLTSRLELYVRAGLNKTWLKTWLAAAPDSSGRASDAGYEGRGLDYGTGLQYAWRPGKLQFSIWLDFNKQFVRLHDAGRPSLDGELEMVTFGVSFGTAL